MKSMAEVNQKINRKKEFSVHEIVGSAAHSCSLHYVICVVESEEGGFFIQCSLKTTLWLGINLTKACANMQKLRLKTLNELPK